MEGWLYQQCGATFAVCKENITYMSSTIFLVLYWPLGVNAEKYNEPITLPTSNYCKIVSANTDILYYSCVNAWTCAPFVHLLVIVWICAITIFTYILEFLHVCLNRPFIVKPTVTHLDVSRSCSSKVRGWRDQREASWGLFKINM